ncbi:MAG: hypothetical protein Q8R53_03105 [Nanoarchaeota archaeon]|nr:hypothetical protein [Nanoarchaeota archaeon]
MSKPYYQKMPLEEALKRVYYSESNPNGALDQWSIGLVEIEGQIEKWQWQYRLKEDHYKLKAWCDQLTSVVPLDVKKKNGVVLELAVREGLRVVVKGNLSVNGYWRKQSTPGGPHVFQKYNRYNGRYWVKEGSILILDIKTLQRQAGELSLYEGGLEGALTISEKDGALSVVDEDE